MRERTVRLAWAIAVVGTVGCGRNAAPPARHVTLPDHAPTTYAAEEEVEPESEAELDAEQPVRFVARDEASWVLAVRDRRKLAEAPRARALLITEATALERLFEVTPRDSPDRPKLIYRLASGYVELRYAARRDRIAADFRGDAQGAARDGKIERAAGQKAIANYELLAREYPALPTLDDVLFHLAWEHEQAGDLLNARRTYFELIQKVPNSPHVPETYLAFGELFLAEARTDPSMWALAEAAYREVTKYPPPNDAVACFAAYRLIEVFIAQGKDPHETREDARHCVERYPDQAGALDIRAALQ